MADVDQALFEALTGSGPVAAVIAQRCYPQLAPQGAAQPFVAYQRTDQSKALTCDSLGEPVRSEYDVDCVDGSHLVAEQLADLVTTALHGTSHGAARLILVMGRSVRCEPRPGDETITDYAATLKVSVFSGG